MKTLKDFLQIIDRQTFFITLLALLSTGLCRYFGILVNIPTELIGIAVIFPLVFSMGGAYKQRDNVLFAFASLKAHTVALYYAHRDWPDSATHQETMRGTATGFLLAVVRYFRSKVGSQEAETHFQEIYQYFSSLSRAHEQLRRSGVGANEIARANQYLVELMQSFEAMNNTMHYRPPLALRAHSRLFLNLFPITFGPYFANLSPEIPWAGFAIAALYAIVLVSLDNVQDQLENPFDTIGPDDLRLEVVEEYLRLLA